MNLIKKLKNFVLGLRLTFLERTKSGGKRKSSAGTATPEQATIFIPTVALPVNDVPVSAPYKKKGKLWFSHFDEEEKLWKPGQLNGMGEHRGTDFACPLGTPVRACVDGVIEFVGEDPDGFGLYIKQIWGDSRVYYGHLGSAKVQKHDTVKVGKILGYSGNSGRSTGPHLHVEFRKGNGLSRQAFEVNFV